jgi:hypothetical protein
MLCSGITMCWLPNNMPMAVSLEYRVGMVFQRK